MVKGNSRKTGKAFDFEYCSFSLCLPSLALATDAEEDLLDFSVSLAFLELALMESMLLRASGARLLERDLILVSLLVVAFFFFSLPLRASGARLLERDLVLVNNSVRGFHSSAHARLLSALRLSAVDRCLAFACCDNLVFDGRRPTARRIKSSVCFEVFWFGRIASGIHL